MGARNLPRAHRSQLTRIDRIAFGVVLRLPDSDSDASGVEEVEGEEKRCCEFWGFQLRRAAAVMLRWDGPPDAGTWMDAPVECFERRQPAGSRFGRFWPTAGRSAKRSLTFKST